jgi:dihydroorotate dehydrogenase
MERFAPLADYLAVNISSPNSPELRQLQQRQWLDPLLRSLTRRQTALAKTLGRHVPLLVKLSPDLDDTDLDAALETILDAGVDGVIATNTTISRDGVRSTEAGGLSGAALTERSTRVVRAITERTADRLPVVACGGVMTPDDARAMLDAGARLVQLYTGLIYEGPGLVKRIAQTL